MSCSAARRACVALVMLATVLVGRPVGAADYAGPLIDAHSHVPNATSIDA